MHWIWPASSKKIKSWIKTNLPKLKKLWNTPLPKRSNHLSGMELLRVRSMIHIPVLVPYPLIFVLLVTSGILGIQGWKYLTGGQDFDGFVTILSAAGIGLSTTPFLDGTNALAKNILKYLKKVPASINKGLLKKFLSGKISPDKL